ncbi:hypothetical protein [Reichenbachiella ulvae]|uniref:Ig-like domain-containing protein n=1 Tax=Reichenbachiella ulvae TaxID=2980104 RepID=A0ABT3CVG4_9BACT|nr:hypothetical protein [Reichenbachiella ulvae]MCV9387681.1 hypothetical protein [Reichenbachiella ulvae]
MKNLNLVFLLFHFLSVLPSLSFCQGFDLNTIHLPEKQIDRGSDFGATVAGNKDFLIIGAPSNNQYGYKSGIAYLYVRSETGWGDAIPIEPDSIQRAASFGYSIDIEDNILVVGAPGYWTTEYPNSLGRVFIFQIEGTTIQQIGVLRASETISYCELGIQVKIENDVIVASAARQHLGNVGQGQVFVFERPVTGWNDMTETAIMEPSNPNSHGSFGISLDLQGNTIVAGAGYSTNTELGNPGAVYVFNKKGENWVSTTEDTCLYSSNVDDIRFGHKIQLEGNTLFTSSDYRFVNRRAQTPHLYVYDLSPSNYCGLLADLSLSDEPKESKHASPSLQDLKFYQDTIFWGLSNIGEDQLGRVMVYTQEDGQWASKTEDRQILFSETNLEKNYFGASLEIINDTLIVGAPRDREGDHAGSVSMFRTSDLSKIETLAESDSSAIFHKLGNQIRVSGNYAAALSSNRRLYLYSFNGQSWDQIMSITAPENYYFRNHVDIYGQDVIVNISSSSDELSFFTFSIPELIENAENFEIIQTENSSSSSCLSLSLTFEAFATSNLSGEVFTFEKTKANWQQTSKITISEEDSYRFGYALQISETNLFIQAPEHLDTSGQRGGVLVYNKNKNGYWSYQSTIIDPDNETKYINLSFGKSMTVFDTILFVSRYSNVRNQNSIYLYNLNDLNDPIHQISDTDSTHFGMELTYLSGHLISSYQDVQNSEYITVLALDDELSLDETIKINYEGSSSAMFGNSISSYSNHLLVAAHQENNSHGESAGAIYFYKKNNNYIKRVYTESPNGQYGPGESVSICIEYAEPVDIAEDSYVLLQLKNGTSKAYYRSGSNSKIIKFSYMPQVGDYTDDLAVNNIHALYGEVKNTDGNLGVSNTLPPKGTTNSLCGSAEIEIAARPPMATFTTSSRFVNAPFSIALSFDKPVSELSMSNFNIENGELQSLNRITDKTYELQISPIVEGIVSFELVENSATDKYGLVNERLVDSIEYDITPPIVNLSYSILEGNYWFEIAIAGNETLDEISKNALILENLSLTSFSNDSIKTVNAIKIDQSLISKVTLGEIKDLAGNNAQPTTLVIDTIEPTVTLSSNSTLINGPIEIDILSSEPVSQMTAENFECANCDISNITNTKALVTPTNTTGPATVHLKGNTIYDNFGNSNNPSNTLHFLIDMVAPNATFFKVPYQDQQTSLFLTFSEEVTPLNENHIHVFGSSNISISSLGNNTYVIVAPLSTEEFRGFNLRKESIFDLAGNQLHSLKNQDTSIEVLSVKEKTNPTYIVKTVSSGLIIKTETPQYKNGQLIVSNTRGQILINKQANFINGEFIDSSILNEKMVLIKIVSEDRIWINKIGLH